MKINTACEHHQVQLSALLDDQIEPRDMRAALDHVLDCPECARFYREARGLQLIVERIEPVAAAGSAGEPGVAPATSRDRARSALAGWLRPTPAWGWAAAVLVAAAVGLWGGGRWFEAPAPDDAGRSPVVGFRSEGSGDAAHAASEPAGGEPIAVAAGDDARTIDVRGDGVPMNEERFVELTVELLRADRRYQQEMSAVLKQVDRLYTEDGHDAL